MACQGQYRSEECAASSGRVQYLRAGPVKVDEAEDAWRGGRQREEAMRECAVGECPARDWGCVIVGVAPQ